MEIKLLNRISVIIATYNRAHVIHDVLESLLNQENDGSFDYVIIVIDNNSTDDTKIILENYKRKSKGRLHVLFEKKIGKHYALNAGLKVAKGDIIAFTDDDVIVTKNWLSIINKIFQNTTSIEMATGKIIPLWSDNKPEWYSESMRSVIPHIDLGDFIKPTDYATGANMVMKSSVIKRFGPFEDSQAIEDSLFSRKVSKEVIIWYIPKLLVYHKILENRLNKNYFRNWYTKLGKSMAIIRSKYDKWDRTFLHVPIWFYRKMIVSLFKYLIHVFNSKERFYHECRIRRQLSFCWTLWFGNTGYSDR